MAESFKKRCQQALAAGIQAQQETSNWKECWNRIYGVGGEFGRLFPTPEERTKFVQSPEYQELTKLMESMPGNQIFQDKVAQASGKLNIRIPKSLHAALQDEAEHEGISLNMLIVSKLSSQLSEAVTR